MDKEILEILKRMETKLDEHTEILRALEHSSQVNKAEHDQMSNDIAHAHNWADIARLKAVK